MASKTQTYLGTNRPITFMQPYQQPAGGGPMNTPTNKNFRYQDSGRPIQMLTPYQGAGSSTAMSAATAPAAQSTDPVPVQQVRQQELADAFQGARS